MDLGRFCDNQRGDAEGAEEVRDFFLYKPLRLGVSAFCRKMSR